MPPDPYPPSPASRAAGRKRLDVFIEEETQKLLRPGESVLHAALLVSLLVSPQALVVMLLGGGIVGVLLVVVIAIEAAGHPALILGLAAAAVGALVVAPAMVVLFTRTFYLAAVTRRRVLLIRVPQGLLGVQPANMGTEEIALRDVLAMEVDDGLLAHRLDIVFGPDRRRVFHLSTLTHPVSGQEEFLDFAAAYHRGLIDAA